MNILKRFLLILSVLFIAPAYAGPLEDAMASNDKIFLYLYTPSCGACKQFNSNYLEYSRKYASQCKFVKINAHSSYGARIAHDVGLRYVPWVVLIDMEKKQRKHFKWECLREPACAKRTLESFVNN